MNIYLVIVLAVLVGEYLLSTVVDMLNVKHLSRDLPGEFSGCYDEERYRKSQDYLKENTFFGIFTGTVFTAGLLAFILAGGFNLIDVFARSFGFAEIPSGLVFAGILMLLSSITRIPFSAYHTFVIEEKFGFNRTTLKTFALDILKEWLIVAVIGGVIFSLIILFFMRAGGGAWLYCWLCVTAIQLFLTFIAPVVIMPLFNKFIPLEDGELKTSIEDYAKSQEFKLSGIFRMDASKRSSKSNAFFTGFGRYRRIVLYDTLISRHAVDELVSVLAHEMGHFRKKHILKFLAVSTANTGLMFYILSLFLNNPGLFSAFKMQNLSVYASLFFFAFLYTPISLLISVLTGIFSRKYEYEADRYAVETYGKPEAMITALKKLSTDNLSNLTPHPLKVFLEYSHPPVLSRINQIRNLILNEHT